jgi:hypothetical protein
MTIITKFALVALLGAAVIPAAPFDDTTSTASSTVIVIGTFSGSVGSLAGV